MAEPTAAEKLLIADQKKECDTEYYSKFAKRGWFYSVLGTIFIFLIVTGWSLTASKDIDREQIRQLSRIERLDEKQIDIEEKFNKIDEKLDRLLEGK